MMQKFHLTYQARVHRCTIGVMQAREGASKISISCNLHILHKELVSLLTLGSSILKPSFYFSIPIQIKSSKTLFNGPFIIYIQPRRNYKRLVKYSSRLSLQLLIKINYVFHFILFWLQTIPYLIQAKRCCTHRLRVNRMRREEDARRPSKVRLKSGNSEAHTREEQRGGGMKQHVARVEPQRLQA